MAAGVDVYPDMAVIRTHELGEDDGPEEYSALTRPRAVSAGVFVEEAIARCWGWRTSHSETIWPWPPRALTIHAFLRSRCSGTPPRGLAGPPLMQPLLSGSTTRDSSACESISPDEPHLSDSAEHALRFVFERGCAGG